MRDSNITQSLYFAPIENFNQQFMNIGIKIQREKRHPNPVVQPGFKNLRNG